ncbi:MAG: VOC family protein [Gammaproteobacteria bacterium]|nr:VOC family protein [Gammaproteobacteria bacterium]
MHKSRLAGFIIDCETADLEAAAAFWGAALGMRVRRLPDAEGERYVALDDERLDLHIEVQAVTHPSRVHLDIEADDIDKEVGRLRQLGATPIEQVGAWWVMQAPTGQRFCVVQAQSERFESGANEWK